MGERTARSDSVGLAGELLRAIGVETLCTDFGGGVRGAVPLLYRRAPALADGTTTEEEEWRGLSAAAGASTESEERRLGRTVVDSEDIKDFAPGLALRPAVAALRAWSDPVGERSGTVKDV